MSDLVTEPEAVKRMLDSIRGRHRHGVRDFWVGAAIAWLLFGVGVPFAIARPLTATLISPLARAIVIGVVVVYSAGWLFAIGVASRQELVVTADDVEREGPFRRRFARQDIAGVGIRRSKSGRPAFLVLQTKATGAVEFPLVGRLREVFDRGIPPN